jgi:predicted ester cyclase
MSAEQNKQSVKRLFNDGINKQDLSIAKEVIADNYVNHGFPGSNPGLQGFMEVINGFTSSFSDLRINQEEVIAEGETVATRGRWTGKHSGEFMGMKPTGKSVEVQFADFWKFSNGKAVENWVYMDMMGLMQQLSITK